MSCCHIDHAFTGLPAAFAMTAQCRHRCIAPHLCNERAQRKITGQTRHLVRCPRRAAHRTICSWHVMPLVAAESRTAGRWYGRADPKAVVP